MPRMDGIQFLQRLKDEEGDRAPAVIMLTGYGVWIRQ